MRDKNQKNNQKTKEQKKYVFEIHTMRSDNEQKAGLTSKKAPPAKLPVTGAAASHKSQKQLSSQHQDKKQHPQSENPFLTQKTTSTETKGKKGSFAPGKKSEPIEKINYTPEDIAPHKKSSIKNSQNSQKKTIHIIMIIFIVLFLLGIVGFGIYMLKFNNQVKVDDKQMQNENLVDIPLSDDSVAETGASTTVQMESLEQTYSTNLPNYFSIDVESESSKDNIATELAAIAQNMQKQDIVGPISFMVTDTNNNPISFHVFALSTDMNLPQDILTALEENFEIYAYQDGINGIRFGFVVDAKNVDILQVALKTHETTLPQAFDLILNGLGTTATDIVFGDSVYSTHPIRFYNLNETETYSVDYTINDQRFVLGSTKNTMRALIDYLKNN